MIRQRFSFSLFVVMLLGLMPLLTINAQGLPATPLPGSAPTGVLAEFDIDELPAPHAEVWFVRMGLQPDGSLPLGPQAGPAVVYVESGQVTLWTDVPVEFGGEGADTAGMATPEGNGETLVAAGDSVLITEGTSVSATNATDEPVTFLILLMYSAEREGEGDAPSEEPVGLTQQAISVGTAEFLTVPATLTMERVVVEPAGTMTTEVETPEGFGPGWLGIELGAVETGSAEMVLENRTLQNLIWPGTTVGMPPEPVLIPLTATVQLDTGDSYSAFNSTVSWTATGDEPLTILRVVVTPHPM